MVAMSSTTGPAPIEAIDRAVTLLETLSTAGPSGLSLAEIVTRAGMNKSTAYRALATLRSRGYAAQDPITGHYSLGPAVMALSDHWLGQDRIRQQLHPALMAVSQQAQELTHLGILSGTDVVYVDKVEPQRALRVWSRVGSTVPAATTALGRALLATTPLTRDQLTPFLTNLPSHTDAGAVWEQISFARARGYAREDEENEPGIACVGFALMRKGSAVAALSVTAPAERMTATRVDEVVGIVRSTLPPLLPEGITLPPPLA